MFSFDFAKFSLFVLTVSCVPIASPESLAGRSTSYPGILSASLSLSIYLNSLLLFTCPSRGCTDYIGAAGVILPHTRWDVRSHIRCFSADLPRCGLPSDCRCFALESFDDACFLFSGQSQPRDMDGPVISGGWREHHSWAGPMLGPRCEMGTAHRDEWDQDLGLREGWTGRVGCELKWPRHDTASPKNEAWRIDVGTRYWYLGRKAEAMERGCGSFQCSWRGEPAGGQR